MQKPSGTSVEDAVIDMLLKPHAGIVEICSTELSAVLRLDIVVLHVVPHALVLKRLLFMPHQERSIQADGYQKTYDAVVSSNIDYPHFLFRRSLTERSSYHRRYQSELSHKAASFGETPEVEIQS